MLFLSKILVTISFLFVIGLKFVDFMVSLGLGVIA